MENQIAVRLVYIHGFRGDHTSFQAFPTDLHQRLLGLLPNNISLESCLYPTYKSRRPISEATSKFLEWLAAQPRGPVILLAHSMGGLLAAEAAYGPSAQSKRVIGLVSFDVPFLGMHPHVVVSGIASLRPKESPSEKTEKELNDENVVNIEPGDSVVNFPSLQPSPRESLDARGSQKTPSHSQSPSGSQLSLEWEAEKAVFLSSGARAIGSTISRSRSPSPSSSFSSFMGSYVGTKFSGLAASIPLSDKLDKAAAVISKHIDDPFVRWMRKHSDDPLSAMTTWIVEHFEFGICMFDPNGLSDRYRHLEKWDGKWINYWTQTIAEPGEGASEKQDLTNHSAIPSNTADMAQYEAEAKGSADAEARDSSSGSNQSKESDKEAAAYQKAELKARKEAEKAIKKQRERERKQKEPRPARHFIVLPHLSNSVSNSVHFGSKEKWEKLTITGVEDEVGAHTGLFIKSQNSEYSAFVERVAQTVAGWCREIDGAKLTT